MLRIRILAALVCLLLAPLHLLAQPLVQSIPADALVYVGWAGSDALAPQYEKSNLKGFLDASTLQAFVTQQVPVLLAKATQQDPKQADNINKALAIAGPIWKHPVAFYFGPVDWTNPQKPLPRLALVCAAGTDAPALEAQLKALPNEQAADEPPVSITVVGDRVILTVGNIPPATRELLGGKAGAAPLADRAEFKAAMKQVGETSAYCVYADSTSLLKELDQAMAADENQNDAEKAKAKLIIDLLGIRAITQIAGGGGFTGANWTERGFVGIAGGARTGILSLLNAKPIDDAMLHVVPMNALSFNAVRLDLAAAFTTVSAGIKKVDAQGFQSFQDGLVKAKEAIGLDIEKDILAPLGDQWVLYRAQADATAAVGGTGGFVMVHTLRDPATFTATLTKLEELAATKGLPYPISKETIGGVEVSTLETPQLKVAWAITDGHLFVGQFAALEAAIKQAKTGPDAVKDSIINAAAFGNLRKSLAPAGATVISADYADLAQIYPETYRGLMGMLMLAQMSGVPQKMGINIPATIIPDATKSAPFLTPGASFVWVDAQGLHMASQCAFPGAQIMAGQQVGTVAGAGMATAILLPSLGRARELANRATEAANLTGIGKASIIYANEHNDAMPEHLAELIALNSIGPKQLVSKSSNTKPPVITPEQMEAAAKDWHTIEAEVDAHCDIVYLGKGTRDTSDSSMVLAYSKPGIHGKDGINVMFYDAHTEWVRMPNLAATFENTNTYRKEHNLPPITFPITPRPATRSAP